MVLWEEIRLGQEATDGYEVSSGDDRRNSLSPAAFAVILLLNTNNAWWQRRAWAVDDVERNILRLPVKPKVRAFVRIPID